jgi:Bacteriocin-protection, YdeI or OmpD-Associated
VEASGRGWRSRSTGIPGRAGSPSCVAATCWAGVVTGDEVEVDVEFDAEPRVVVEPADFASALDADPVARTAYDRLAYGHKVQHVRAIESAKKSETRTRRIEKAVAMLRDRESARGSGAGPKTRRRSQRS